MLHSLVLLLLVLGVGMGLPLILFDAGWCVSCKIMKREVFGDPAVQRAMAGVRRLRPDVAANDAKDRALFSSFAVAGPPP